MPMGETEGGITNNNTASGQPAPAPKIDERGGEGKNYLIAIGIKEYKLERLNLPTPVDDCKAIADTLTTKYGFTVFEDILINENATKKGIRDIFKRFEALNPTSSDSLIVYYSGHGYLKPIKRDANQRITEGIGCWITHEVESDDIDDMLRISNFLDYIRLMPQLRHVIIISDCCNSGTMLEASTFYNGRSQLPGNIQSLEMAPSRWAVCSSHGNENSASGEAGKPGALSLFTEALVGVLKNSGKSRMSLNSLMSAVAEKFDSTKWQKPDWGPLNIIDNNVGEFVFRAAPNLVVIRKRENILSQSINLLNYKNQFTSFGQLGKKGKTQFAIFSGRPTCGLPLLSFYARKFFLKNTNYFPVTHTSFTGPGQLTLVNGLKAALKIPPTVQSATLETIGESILARMEKSPVTIELRFYNELKPGAITLPEPLKKNLITRLAEFAEKINNANTSDHHFYIFVVDYEYCDYTALFSGEKIGAIDSIIVPRTNAISMEELCKWYEAMQRNQIDLFDDSKLREFEELFSALPGVFEQLLQETSGYPGSTLIRICQEAECNDLVRKIIDPDNN